MLKDDFVMRDVDTLVNTIARLVLHQETADYTPTGREEDAEADGLWFALDQYIKAGDFNAAEDLLYERADWQDLRYLEMGVAFYAHLNHLSDQELAEGGFDRDEVGEGLRDLAQNFGVDLKL